ncbi:MAG: UDP-glucose/GDP-mannose dehydrogenase family protein [Candidatus Diapherotrites archaeon]|nr:UDP-glucose/GDP-mannose dehydrogenase family protein [Candidatus Diapherotrites archaeon]
MKKVCCLANVKNVCVVGTGYVGLVAGACFADMGHNVTCVDIDERKISMLRAGKIPIFEPGLGELVRRNSANGRLSFTTSLPEAVGKCAIIFIAVGTPPKEDGTADLSFVRAVAKEIALSAKEPKIVVEKSTVPVETGEMVLEILAANSHGNVSFEVVSNPEFLREGSAVGDFMKPDRIVVGTDSEHARKELGELYAPLKAKILFTDIKSAEIIKHAANSFLATKISFINSVAMLSEAVGADIKLIAEGVGLDSRIGPKFLNAGIGYGGSCFPKDVSAFIQIADRHGVNFSILKEVENVNKGLRPLFVGKIEKAVGGVKGKKIAVLGLAFKPDTDDMREAPSVDIISALAEKGARVFAFDPEAEERAKSLISSGNVSYCGNEFDAIQDADALVILTEWPQFAKLDLARVKSALKSPVVIDGRNIFEKAEMARRGFTYVSIGR